MRAEVETIDRSTIDFEHDPEISLDHYGINRLFGERTQPMNFVRSEARVEWINFEDLPLLPNCCFLAV
jgi:hypothetical protein